MMPDSLFFSLSSAIQGLHFRLRVCCAGASGHAAVFTSKPQCLFARWEMCISFPALSASLSLLDLRLTALLPSDVWVSAKFVIYSL